MNRLFVLIFLGGVLASATAAPLIDTNSTWKYFKGTGNASSPDTTAWRTNGFNDSAWLSGAAPFYYENDPTSATAYTGNTDLTDMYNGYSSLFMREKFVVTNLAQVDHLLLTALVDDGYIVWINGTEVARFNMAPGNISFNGTANSSIAEPPPVQNFILPNPQNYLVAGTNVLDIQAFNDSKTGNDFLIWAALNSFTNAVSNFVAITEFMATNHTTVQDQDGDFSPWIELFNPQTNDISLTNWSLTIDAGNLRQWMFPNVTLEANSFMVIFASGKDRETNTAELHTNFRPPVGGGYLALVDPHTNIISSFPAYPAQMTDVSFGSDPQSLELTGFFRIRLRTMKTPRAERSSGRT